MGKRERSAQYPKTTWNECVEFAKTVAEFSLNAVSYSEVAKKLGLSNANTKSFTSKLSTCRQFLLLETSGGNTIHVTDTCKRILFPTGENIGSLIKECFTAPPIYASLVQRYSGKALPTREVLANILMNDYGIVNTVKNSAADAFMDSIEQLDMLRGGILCPEGNNPYNEFRDNISTSEAPVTTSEEQTGDVTNQTVVLPSDSDYITQKIPFESGKVAQISIPVDANEDDLMLLHDMLDVILKRKFKINIS